MYNMHPYFRNLSSAKKSKCLLCLSIYFHLANKKEKIFYCSKTNNFKHQQKILENLSEKLWP